MPTPDPTEGDPRPAGNVVHVELDIDLDRALIRRGGHHGPDDEWIPETPVTLEDLVLDAVVDKIVAKVTSERDGWLAGEQSRVSRVRDEILREKLEPILDAAVAAAIQPTNKLGEGTCEPVTLNDIILQRGQAWLEETIESRTSRGRVSRIQHIINEAVDRTFTSELAHAVNAGKEQIKAALTQHAAALLAETLAKQAEAQGG